VAKVQNRFWFGATVSLAVCLAALAVAAPAAAQEPQRIASERQTLVLEEAPVYLLPDNARQPLRTAAPGTVLEVLSIAEGWVQVRFLDPMFGLRVGYVESRFLEQTSDQTPQNLSVPSEPNVPEAADVVETAPDTGGRGGAWYHLGFGFGRVACGGCFSSSDGMSGGMILGGAISPRVLLGVGTSAFHRSDLGARLTIGTVDARLRLYPLPRIPAFVTGGLGIGGVRLASQNEFGTGAIVGAGWDVAVGRNLSVTPFFNRFLIRSSVIDADVDQIGIGFTIH
jgi:hypothetical protein